MANSFSRTCRALEGDSSGYALLAWALASVILCAWLAWFALVEVTVVEVSQSARLEVERAAHPVAAPIGGRVISTSLRLGKKVGAGDVLMELDAKTERLGLQEERARLTTIPPQLAAIERQINDREQAAKRSRVAASSAIEQARSRHREALSTARYAEENYRRVRQLAASGRLSEIEALRIKTDADKAKAAADALSSEIVRLVASADQSAHSDHAAMEELRRESAKLQGQVEISNAVAARLRQNIEKYVIRAPVSGKVGSVSPFDVGAFVNIGGVVGSIIPDGKLKVVAEFPPARVLGRVQAGQSARMRLDGFPWAQYGSVSLKVDRVAAEIRNNLIRVEFIPDSQNHERLFLQHGLPGTVEVAVEQTTPAMLALRAAGQMLTKPVGMNIQIASAAP
ncbi:MAG: HlyD family secretion protein [Methylococcaceae bacterium]|nr:HlyD family secretion protein [Methylococcaceae bacterium]MCI0732750.1 HlyD family secretion protein [Methylococcaceae bacterium]